MPARNLSPANSTVPTEAEQLVEATRQKLTLEIAGLPPRLVPAAMAQ
jgi:hypothetical protein